MEGRPGLRGDGNRRAEGGRTRTARATRRGARGRPGTAVGERHLRPAGDLPRRLAPASGPRLEEDGMSYPSIAGHGLIGDLQSAALVATDGTIDWFCCPRFDSPSVFASLLDDSPGGRFALAPVTPARTTKQMSMPDSAILVTRFLSESGIAEVVDFMPIDRPRVVSDRRRIVRVVRGIRGEVEFEARVEPRFDYGRRPH